MRILGRPIKAFFKFWFFPTFLYFIFFCFYTYPSILKFSSHLFADIYDGLQTFWDIWWVQKALIDLSQLPWYTTYLHYPYGVSLLPQTLSPFNGFIGVILLNFLTQIEIYNFAVIFSFVCSGVTIFFLAFYLTRSYIGSLLAGFIFTFSNYHFAHLSAGHLMLVSMEWIPLFILCWYRYLEKPTFSRAFLSVIALNLVLLCDYYYLFYCVLIGFFLGIWFIWHKKNFYFYLQLKRLITFILFIVLMLSTGGILVISLLLLNKNDTLFGYHEPWIFSTDILAPFIYGGNWRFSELTKLYWSRITGNIGENSVYLGLTVIFLLIYVWRYRKKVSLPSLKFWYFILFFFFILSLGPILRFWGTEIPYIKGPYAYLEKIFPPIKMSGCPIRMMAIVIFCSALISAVGFKKNILW